MSRPIKKSILNGIERSQTNVWTVLAPFVSKHTLDLQLFSGSMNHDAVHNHETGNANLPYVRISTETREFIAGLLRLGVESFHIVSELAFNEIESHVLIHNF